MNTKQLWQALTSNPITEHYFNGIFPVDALNKIKIKPKLIICNTDPSSKPGKHWLLFFFKNDIVYYYDSIGQDVSFYDKRFMEFLERFSTFYISSNIRTQPNNTDLCGYYCLFFAYFICNGESMHKILSKMYSPEIVITFVKENFDFCINSDCIYSQSCIKN